MLDQVVAVVVHQKVQIPMDENDLAEAVDLCDCLQVLMRVLKGLPSVLEAAIEKLAGLEEVVTGGRAAANMLLAMMQPMIRQVGLVATAPQLLAGAAALGGRRRRRRRDWGRATAVALFGGTGLLGLTGAALLVTSVATRQPLDFASGMPMAAMLCLVFAVASCLAGTFVTQGRGGDADGEDLEEDEEFGWVATHGTRVRQVARSHPVADRTAPAPLSQV